MNETDSLEAEEHPATKAWLNISRATCLPTAVLMLKGKEKRLYRKPKKRCVCRLLGAGPGGSSIIAKLTKTETAELEASIYRDILSHALETQIKCYGTVPEDNEMSWLFIEDVGDGSFRLQNHTHRGLASKWLARLHSRVAQFEETKILPDRGPGYYLEQLHQGFTNIENELSTPHILEPDRVVLCEILDLQKHLLKNWEGIESFCAQMPKTLVHGDFVNKNIRLRSYADREYPSILVYDWETSGLASPAADLCKIDLTVYLNSIEGELRQLSLAELNRLQIIGKIFKMLSAIWWSSIDIKFEYKENPLCRMPIYRNTLSLMLEELEHAC